MNFTFIYSSVTVFLVLYRSGIRHEQDAEPGEEEIRMNSQTSHLHTVQRQLTIACDWSLWTSKVVLVRGCALGIGARRTRAVDGVRISSVIQLDLN